MPVDLTAEEREALNEVRDCFEAAEKDSKPQRDNWDSWYAHYRGYQGLKDSMRKASPPDRDTVFHDAKRDWGTQLAIPFAFSTVETILAREISNRPRMLVLPKDEDAEANVANMRDLIEQQQQQIAYDMVLEETAKSGEIYGLGVQKFGWDKRYATRHQLQEILLDNPQTGAREPKWIEGDPVRECVFDDAMAWNIDLANFFWDRFGSSMETCGWVIHRTWRSTKYVLEQIRHGYWNTTAAKGLEESEVEGMGSTEKYDEAMQKRMEIAGHQDWQSRGKQLHEVWEAHLNGERVVTILDRALPVQIGLNPHWHGQIPFGVFRPTTAGVEQLVGIGSVEPIEQLLREMNTLRSQRRDNAMLKLAQVFAVEEGSVRIDDIEFGPGAIIPVHGQPRDFLYPINVGDIPNSGYQEEEALKGDLERTSGISDSVTGTEGGQAQTATGVQLVQAAANVRIQKHTRRLEVELVTRGAGQWVALNQQRITGERVLMIPEAPVPGRIQPAYRRVKLSPAELAGRFGEEVDGGSIAPKNLPQQYDLAQRMGQEFRNDPMVDQRVLRARQLELYGVTHPGSWLVQEEEPIPPSTLKRIEQMGFPAEKIQMAVAQARREEGPTAGQPEAPARDEMASLNGDGAARGG